MSDSIINPSPDLRRIACQSCGGNINLRGSNEVEMVVCGSCGSQLDISSDEHKIIGKSEGFRSRSFLGIGSQGTLRGIKCEVIGRIRYRQDTLYVWDEFLLYSPEIGYRWLVWENNHFTLLAPTKNKPNQKPSSLSYQKTVNVGNFTFTVFEKASAEITEVEGELTWIAKIKDRMEMIDAINPPQIYCIEWNSKEIEYFIGSYVTQEEIVKGFGLKQSLPSPIGVYPCQPFVTSPSVQAMSATGWIFSSVFVFLLGWAIIAGGGSTVISTSFSGQDLLTGVESQEFPILKANTICKAVFSANVQNAWAWFDIDVVKTDEGEVLDFGEQVSYYTGVEGGESWSEGSQRTSQVFKITDPGQYKLKITGTGGQGESMQEGFTGYNGSITIYRDVVLFRYFVCGLIVALFLPLLQLLRKSLFEHNRWASEEDDDEDE